VNGLGMTFGVTIFFIEKFVKIKKFDLINFDKDNLEEKLKKIKKESFNFLKKEKCFFVGGFILLVFLCLILFLNL
jgi:cytoskeletal protein RodZ